MQEMSLFFRDAVGNIWEGNVMMSGTGFRILLQNEAKMLKIYMFYLLYFYRCEHFNKKENFKAPGREICYRHASQPEADCLTSTEKSENV